MLRVVALVFACACGRVGFDPLSGDGAISGDGGGSSDARTACANWSAWSNPVRVQGINSTGIDWAPSISDDSLFLTFSSNRTGNHELYTTSRQSLADVWDPPAVIGELTNMFDEEDDATLSADLREMIFGKTAIFRTTRPDLSSAWGARTMIVPADFDLVQGAELSGDDLRLYFSGGDAGLGKIFLKERTTTAAAFGPYVPLTPELDPGNDVGYPTLSADELEIFVSADHGGERDIYTARRAVRSDPFPQVIRVAALSQAATVDWDPELSNDGTLMWIATDRGTGGGGVDIFEATRTCQD